MCNNLASSYLTISSLNRYALQSETRRYQHNENELTTQSISKKTEAKLFLSISLSLIGQTLISSTWV